MKLQSVILYGIGVILLIFGNKEFFENLKEEKELAKEKERQALEAENEKKKSFEVQKLEYDSAKSEWRNPNFYFQIVNVGNVNFKALKKNAKVQLETNDDEKASESK
ncbi:hypothetical protein ABEG63_11955 [Chryseobacterium sp. C39-AII1]|uniref:hypothetical protein n=1 Tax=Chryseobacterium sp. C39-AII1 TaxID=3080332 RepID=UPI00320AD212